MTFELDIDKIKEQGLQLVDMAKKTALDLADKGKNQLDLVNAQTRLSKAQRQLGALVYSLHKSGEDNQPLVDKYIENIAEIEASIESIKAHMSAAEAEEAEAAAVDAADVTDAAEVSARNPRRKSTNLPAARPRSARCAAPGSMSTRCSATTAARSCKF